jgi:hypothetical protein
MLHNYRPDYDYYLSWSYLPPWRSVVRYFLLRFPHDTLFWSHLGCINRPQASLQVFRSIYVWKAHKDDIIIITFPVMNKHRYQTKYCHHCSWRISMVTFTHEFTSPRTRFHSSFVFKIAMSSAFFNNDCYPRNYVPTYFNNPLTFNLTPTN